MTNTMYSVTAASQAVLDWVHVVPLEIRRMDDGPYFPPGSRTSGHIACPQIGN